MIRFLRTALAFVRIDILQATSYRLSFLLGIGGLFVSLLFVMLVSDFVGPFVGERLQGDGYGEDYFGFLVLGLGMHTFLDGGLQALSARIRQGQMQGTLEALMTTRTSLVTILLCLPLPAFLGLALRFVGYLVLGAVVFDMPVTWGRWSTAVPVLLLSIAAFSCLGLVIGGLTIAFKRTGPLHRVVSGLSMFLGGVYYPIEALPEPLQGPAHALPIVPGLEGLRASLLGGAGIGEVAPALANLAILVVVLFPLGISCFRWSLRRAMRDGTLTQY